MGQLTGRVADSSVHKHALVGEQEEAQDPREGGLQRALGAIEPHARGQLATVDDAQTQHHHADRMRVSGKFGRR